MKSILTINNHKVISWNELYEARHWRVRKGIADEIHQLVKYESMGQEIPSFDKPVTITVIAGKHDHLVDCDNVCSKLYIDGLVGAGVIDNDSTKYVSQVTTRSVKGNINYVEIEIDDK